MCVPHGRWFCAITLHCKYACLCLSNTVEKEGCLPILARHLQKGQAFAKPRLCTRKFYLLRLSPALHNENISIDVLHTYPTGQTESGIRPNPVHDRPHLSQERDHTETRREEEEQSASLHVHPETTSGSRGLHRVVCSYKVMSLCLSPLE